MSPTALALKTARPSSPARSSDTILSLHPHDNHTIRLLSSYHDLTLRDTVHQIITHYLSTHDIDLGQIFADPKSILPKDL